MYEAPLPENDAVIEIAMRKMALEIKSMPQDVKDRAGMWLDDHGYARRIKEDTLR